MADEVEAPEVTEAGAEEQPQKGGKMTSILLLVVGLGLGSGAGLFFVGPLVAGGPAETTDEPSASEQGAEDGGHDAPTEDDGHGAPADDGHGAADIGDDGVDPLIHAIPNVIVNPSGSNGNRILLLDVAFRLNSESAVNELTGRDAEVRDALIHMLGVMTVGELADISARDAIKAEMKDMVSSILSGGHVTAIFFPRYVIQ